MQVLAATLQQQRQASQAARQTLASFRGKGDDVLSEHERHLRLEEAARRAAEREARENLHRWNGVGGYRLIFAVEKARLGLQLTSEERNLLELARREKEKHLLEGSSKFGDWSANVESIQLSFTQAQIDEARRVAIYEAKDTAQSSGLKTAGSGVVLTAVDPQLEEEANKLITLIASFVRQAGEPLDMPTISTELANKTGKSWGAFWESRHGPILPFLQKYGDSKNLHILKGRYLGLDGMTTPESARSTPTKGMDPVNTDMNPFSEPETAIVPAMNHAMVQHGTADALNWGSSFPDWETFGTNNANTTSNALTRTSGQYSTAMTSTNPFGGFDLSEFDPLMDEKRRREEERRNELARQQELERERIRAEQARIAKEEAERRMREEHLATAKALENWRREKELASAAVARQLAEDEALARRLAEEEHNRALASMRRDRGSSDAADRPASLARQEQALREMRGKSTAGRRGTASDLVPYGSDYGDFGRAPASRPRAIESAAEDRLRALQGYGRIVNEPSGSLSSERRGATPHRLALNNFGGDWDEEQFAQSTVRKGVCEGDENMTWNDFDVLFRPLLVNGFSLIKHGRSGPPKTRRFWMTDNMSRLCWDTSRVVDVLTTGERSIPLADIIQLIDGIGTDLLRKKVVRGEIHPSRQSKCILRHG